MLESRFAYFMFLKISFSVLLVAIVVYYVVHFFQCDIEVDGLLETDAVVREKFFGSDPVSEAYNEVTGSYNFARRSAAIDDLNMPKSINWVQTMTQRKEFIWVSASDGNLLFGLALLQFNYISAIVVNIFDTAANRSWKQKIELPFAKLFGFGPTFLPGVNGKVSPTSKGHSIIFNHSFISSASACVVSTGTTLQVSASGFAVEKVSGQNQPFAFSFELSIPSEHLNMVFPLGPHRASAVSKFAGASIVGPLKARVGDRIIHSPLSVGGIDYTRGLLRRETTWFWTCFSTIVNGASVGVHLSAFTYDVQNVSMESTVFLDKKMYFVGRPIVWKKLSKGVPSQFSEWTVRTPQSRADDGNNGHERISIDLHFVPNDLHLGTFHYGVMTGDLYHIWGEYSGSITVGSRSFSLVRTPGVLEDHYALW